MIHFEPKPLEGQLVRLVPLQLEHRNQLMIAASDGELWKLWYTSVPSSATVDQYIDAALEQYAEKKSIPFVVIEKLNNKIIGTTRYCNIDLPHRRLEIGYTWYAQSYHRTGINTECKYLLLLNAFETFQTIAVEFRTHWHNHVSRNAILRLGAKQDGILRNHRILSDGSLRDTVVYSIIETEWPSVKTSLEHKLSL